MTDNLEQRKWPRHKVKIPVSFKCRGIQNLSLSWHVGETMDISVDGMRVISSSLGRLPLSSELTLLCFPKKNSLASYIQEPEPLWIKGHVIWQDSDNKVIGLHLVS